MKSICRSFSRLLAALILLGVPAISRAEGEVQFVELGDFNVENGQVIRHCRVGYRVFGTLNPEKSNAILFPTWFGGKSDDLVNFIGQGKMLDSSGLYIVAVDALGNGISSSPSN